MHLDSRRALTTLREESIKRLKASEKAVEHRFHEARLLASLAAALTLAGFLLVAQWRGVESYAAARDELTDRDLAVIIQEMTAENNAMRSEASRLELRVWRAGDDEESRGEVLNQAATELRDIRLVAGLESASGPGVTLRLGDPRGELGAADLVDALNELRAAGAEAVAVDGRRVEALSGFSERDGTLYLDARPLQPGPEFSAIGDPEALEQALKLPGGLLSTLAARPGVRATVEVEERLQLPALKTR